MSKRIKRVIENQEVKSDGDDKACEFKWDDIVDEAEAEGEGEGEILVISEKEANECASVLAVHLMAQITGKHISGMQIVIPVDSGIHALLQKRFEEKWNLDSRLDMFQSIREHLVAEFTNNDKRVELNAKIQEALPPANKKFTSGEVSLEDDAMVVGDQSNMISIEIPLVFAINL